MENLSAINWENVVQGAKPKQNDKETLEKKADEKSSDIIYAAREVLGDYLIRGDFPWKNEVSGNPALESFLKNFGGYALRIMYQPGNDYNFRINFCSMPNDITEKLLDKIADGYYKKTDLKAEPGTEIDYRSLFPEFAIINKSVNNQGFSNIYSPLMIVMMMESSKRPLMAVALKKMSEESKIQLIKGSVKNCLPYLEAVIESAKEYDITKIKDVISEFNKCSGQIFSN